MTVLRFEQAQVEIVVANRELATSISQAIQEAMNDFVRPPKYPTVRLRTFRRLETLDVKGHIAIVRVTDRGLRRLPKLVEEIRGRGALGVQLLWDGESPPRDRAEPTIFQVLEAARSTKHLPPVVVASSHRSPLTLRALIRSQTCPA
jgi:hypothetical protein